MSVTKAIEEFLAATFQLPIVRDITQTKIGRAIGYQITASRINTKRDAYQTHHAEVVISLRSENGYDELGFLSAKLAESDPSGEGWRVMLTSGRESVDYVTMGEILISTAVTIQLNVWHDTVKEQIKSINFEASNG